MQALPVETAREGSCNFCTDRPDPEYVWELRSSNPSRRSVIRICDRCMGEVREATSYTINPRRKRK